MRLAATGSRQNVRNNPDLVRKYVDQVFDPGQGRFLRLRAFDHQRQEVDDFKDELFVAVRHRPRGQVLAERLLHREVPVRVAARRVLAFEDQVS